MKSLLLICLFASFSISADLSQAKKSIDPNQDDLVIFPKPAKLDLKKSATVSTHLKFEVVDGFHIQSNPAKPRLIPTTLKMDVHPGVTYSEIVYPPGKPYRLKGSNSDISVYEGKFELNFKTTIGATAKTGLAELTGKLRYQACNDITCFFPKEIPVKIPINIQ